MHIKQDWSAIERLTGRQSIEVALAEPLGSSTYCGIWRTTNVLPDCTWFGSLVLQRRRRDRLTAKARPGQRDLDEPVAMGVRPKFLLDPMSGEKLVLSRWTLNVL